jgi:putative transposase
MLYAQLSTKKSLRDLVFSLDRHRQKLYHLGLTPVKRSTLAEANEKRPALIFQKTYEKLLARFQAEAGRQPQARRVKILDATYVPVCASLFPWANFQPSKNAVKLHVLLDSVGAPQDLQVTPGHVHELEVARRLDFARGDLVLLDRGYVDCDWMFSLHPAGWGLLPGCPATSAIGSLRSALARPTRRCRPINSFGSALITAGVTIPKPCAWCITGTRKPARTMYF